MSASRFFRDRPSQDEVTANVKGEYEVGFDADIQNRNLRKKRKFRVFESNIIVDLFSIALLSR